MKSIFLLALLVFPAVLLSFNSGSNLVAYAEEDDDTDDVDVEGEGEGDDTAVTDDGSEEEELLQTGASPDADTTILFTKPLATLGSLELPAGHIVEFLVGFHNNGKQDFILEAMEASFRYPADFNFHIQNFSMIPYNKVVKPGAEATLDYSFMTPESFAGRPFGLNVHLNYRDVEGNLFGEAVFNETVNVIELEEGLDGETFFLYVFLAACFVLLLFVGQQFLASSVGKKRVGKKTVVETGTSNPNDVDYDWLPKEMLSSINKSSPKNSPRSKHHQSPKATKQNASKQQSPRQRKTKRTAGRDD